MLVIILRVFFIYVLLRNQKKLNCLRVAVLAQSTSNLLPVIYGYIIYCLLNIFRPENRRTVRLFETPKLVGSRTVGMSLNTWTNKSIKPLKIWRTFSNDEPEPKWRARRLGRGRHKSSNFSKHRRRTTTTTTTAPSTRTVTRRAQKLVPFGKFGHKVWPL